MLRSGIAASIPLTQQMRRLGSQFSSLSIALLHGVRRPGECAMKRLLLLPSCKSLEQQQQQQQHEGMSGCPDLSRAGGVVARGRGNITPQDLRNQGVRGEGAAIKSLDRAHAGLYRPRVQRHRHLQPRRFDAHLGVTMIWEGSKPRLPDRLEGTLAVKFKSLLLFARAVSLEAFNSPGA
eukprot:766564-Hanusia_phi.AAC.3